MGAFGVAMGFAAFVLVREETQAKHASPVTFLLGLLAASITSYMIEAVRERAEGHAHGGAIDPGRVLGLLVLLAVFEVYVSGAEQVVKLLAGGEAEKFVSELFVSGIADGIDIIWQLLIFAGLWAVLGAAAAWGMLYDTDVDLAVSLDQTTARTPLLQSIVMPLRRVLRGLVLVAAIALAYVILARIALTIWVLLTRPQDYAPAFNTLMPEQGAGTGNPLGPVTIVMASALEQLAHLGRWGGVALLIVVAVMLTILVRRLRRSQSGMVTVTLSLALGLIALGPFATSPTQMGRLVHIVTATTLTWLAPLVVLSVATPVLRAPSRFPRVWGIVSFAVAMLLVFVTWGKLSQPPVPLFVASLVLALLVTAWLFWRGADVVKFWPLVALTLAVSAFEGSSLLQRLSFLATFKEAALLQSTPLKGGEEARVERGYRAVSEWARDSTISSAVAAVVAPVHNLSPDASAATVDTATHAVDQALDSVYTEALTRLCLQTGSAVIDTLHRDITRWCERARTFSSVSTDSINALSEAIRATPEPLGGWSSALLDSVDASAVSLVNVYRWRNPPAADAASIADQATSRLPVGARELDDVALLSLAMSGRVFTRTERAMAVVVAFARTAPPDTTLGSWMQENERRDLDEGFSGDGLMLQGVLFWWNARLRHLGDLVHARYAAGIPASQPKSALDRQLNRRPFRYDREVRAITALHFAKQQLIARQLELTKGAALEADAGAAVLLELSLGASFAFWATAGLLAGLSRKTEAA